MPSSGHSRTSSSSELRPLQERYAEITAEPGYVERILKEGADRLRPIAEKTLTAAKRGMGFL